MSRKRWLVAGVLAACGQPRKGTFPDPAVSLVAELDQDGSGTLSAAEIPGTDGNRWINVLDGDGDGVISVEELRSDLDADQLQGGGMPTNTGFNTPH